MKSHRTDQNRIFVWHYTKKRFLQDRNVSLLYDIKEKNFLIWTLFFDWTFLRFEHNFFKLNKFFYLLSKHNV